MSQYFLILASAFLLAAGVTPFVRRMAFRLNVVDQPSARKVHVQPIPLLGGAAIYVAFIVTLALLGDRGYIREVAGIFIGATFCSFMGLWDDRLGLGASVKLVGQVLASLVLVISGVRIQLFRIEALNVALTVLWTVGITNSLNLLDNMDGLSGGVGAVAAAFFLLLAAMSRQYLVGALAAALLGACVGFLVYNVNPATIFMGDTGALFLGYMLAAVGIKLRFPANVTHVTWMIPVLVLGLPVFDTTLVFLSRLRRGLNPLTTPGKDHTSHRLVKAGLSHREAVLVLYLVCGALGVLAMYLTQATVSEGYAVGAVVLATGVYAIYRLERIGPLTTATPPPAEPQPAAVHSH
ncbi:MAG: undecaprenyl/decaprenyl-phosphate alpha-N-acetylglucosaminyl 1-phosphate transferase [Chloroflexi bacterium]|nr:undecaprenyl/decaprenyl-phosphate alpha-N-acetylglucosaminyl 1-phosphate transferase [Chloroflexota bacterium]